MQTAQYNQCNAVHPTGILTILGTADAISDYNGMSFGGIQYYVSADDVHQLWAQLNNSPVQQSVALPDTDPSDGSTVELNTWSDGNNCIYVQHFKVIGGGHDWPGSFGNMDIHSDEEILALCLPIRSERSLCLQQHQRGREHNGRDKGLPKSIQ